MAIVTQSAMAMAIVAILCGAASDTLTNVFSPALKKNGEELVSSVTI